MGRPAIVTDVPGCRHAIERDVTGWLCEPRNSGSLAQQMQQVLDMTSAQRQQAGDAARARMEEKFSEEQVVKAYMEFLPD